MVGAPCLSGSNLMGKRSRVCYLWGMNERRWILVVTALSMGVAGAQDQNPLLPRTPTAFETRNAGGTGEGDVSIQKVEAKTVKVTYVAVTESRDWKDTAGKVIRGRLLAFDAVKGDEANLVRDGKIRLLVDGAKGFSLLSLEKLCMEDRTYIGVLADARKPKAALQKVPQ